MSDPLLATAEHRRRRYEHRAEDPPVVALLAWWMRWRGLIGPVAASLVTILVGRLFLLDRIEGQDKRITALQLAQEVLDSTISLRFDGIEAGVNILVRDACMAKSRFEQQRDKLSCPDHLYRGSPQ